MCFPPQGLSREEAKEAGMSRTRPCAPPHPRLLVCTLTSCLPFLLPSLCKVGPPGGLGLSLPSADSGEEVSVSRGRRLCGRMTVYAAELSGSG